MPRDGPIGSLRRSFGDRNHVAQPAGTIEPSPRMSACASGSQIRCELFTERPAGLDEQGPIDSSRETHASRERQDRSSLRRWAICSGDQRWASHRSTFARSRGLRASFAVFGRRAILLARRSARQARYRFRDPLASTSREMVEGARFSRLAIALNESPAFNPREISSRSPTVSRSGERTRRRGG